MAATPEVRASSASVLAVVQATSAAEVRATQAQIEAVYRFPTTGVRSSQAQILSPVKSTMDLRTTQSQVLAVVKYARDTRKIRAFYFPQDEHDFYVLFLGPYGTAVLDMLSTTWSMWSSPDREAWRAIDGLAWNQNNVAVDVAEGILYDIDPDSRMDDLSDGAGGFAAVTISSIVRGMYPMRLRNALGCFRATLTVSEGAPTEGGVGISLRTSDDFGRLWHDHGFLLLDDPSKVYDISWSSIGLITAPGKIFEITDTGYAQRIEALDIDLGSEETQQGQQQGPQG